MSARPLIISIGATALAFGAVIGGFATSPHAVARETPPAQTEATADVPAVAPGDAAAEAYDPFVGGVADELDLAAEEVG